VRKRRAKQLAAFGEAAAVDIGNELEKPAETDHSVSLSFTLRARRPVHIERTSCAEAAIVRMRHEVQSRADECSARRLKVQLTGQELPRITRKEPPRKEAGTPLETAPAALLVYVQAFSSPATTRPIHSSMPMVPPEAATCSSSLGRSTSWMPSIRFHSQTGVSASVWGT
jgi:hypothetical protein